MSKARQLIEDEGNGDELKREAFDSLDFEHEFRDVGIENSQYFQGAGVAGTDWKNAYIGIGDNYQEACENALEQAAEDDWNTDQISTAEFPTSPSVSGHLRNLARREVDAAVLATNDEEAISAAIDEILERDQDSGNELYYYVVLYVK